MYISYAMKILCDKSLRFAKEIDICGFLLCSILCDNNRVICDPLYLNPHKVFIYVIIVRCQCKRCTCMIHFLSFADPIYRGLPTLLPPTTTNTLLVTWTLLSFIRDCPLKRCSSSFTTWRFVGVHV